MQWTRFTRIFKPQPKDSGFTISEMLVAGMMSSIILGASMQLVNSLRQSVLKDQARIQVSQNLRPTLDLIGMDIRQAGERLSPNTTAVEIFNGTSGQPDTLIISSDTAGLPRLPVCQEINGSSSRDNIQVAQNVSPNSPNYITACDQNARDGDGDQWPDDLEQWQQFRTSQGGSVFAYIYDPSTSLGEFFTYDAEDNSGQHLHRANGTAWQNNYTTSSYVILGFQEKTYQLVDNPNRVGDKFLQVTIRDALNWGTVKKIANRLTDFQVQAWMPDDNVAKTSFPTFIDNGTSTSYRWTDVKDIEVQLTSATPGAQFNVPTDRLTTVGNFLPRNVFSNREGS